MPRFLTILLDCRGAVYKPVQTGLSSCQYSSRSRQIQDNLRYKEQNQQGSSRQCDGDSQAGRRHQTVGLCRSIEEHCLHQPAIVDHRDNGIEQRNHHQPGLTQTPGRGKKEQLAHKARHWRNTSQREQAERRRSTQQRSTPPESPEILDLLTTCEVRQSDNAGESPQVGDYIDQDKEQERGITL